MVRSGVFILLLSFSLELLADTVEGLWKQQGKAVWIQFDADGDAGVVVRNDQKPEAVGFTVARNLEATEDEEDSWKAEVFAAPLGEYKPAEITLLDKDTMRFKVKVGFMSRSVEWQRVSVLPDE
jgi:uncharacterized protein (DUF2147 family)